MAENQNIEYKESWRDEYLQWICGMANSIGGKMFIGMDDKGNVVGVAKPKKLSEDIPNKVKDTMGVIVDCLQHEKDGKDYLEIIIPQTAYAVSYRGHFYYRSGATNLELSQGMLHTFLLSKTGESWDEMPVPNVSIDGLDRDSFKIFRREAIRHKRMSEDELNTMTNKELLDKLHLVTPDGQLKRAAVLLFHEDPEHWFIGANIKVGRFLGSEIRYQDELKGSLMKQADQIMDLVYTKYLIAEISYDNVTRVETYPYSKDAFREGIYNAIMHKDYSSGNPIQIRIEDAKMYISNSKAFNSQWTPETLLAPHNSDPHNPTIANVFYRAGYVEAWGRGINKMCEKCLAWGQPMPEYITDMTNLRLLFKALPTAKEMLISKENDAEGGMKTEGSGMKSGMKTEEGGIKGGMKTEESGIKGGMKTEEGGMKNDLSFFVGNRRITIKGESSLASVCLAIIADPRVSISALAERFDLSRNAIQKHIDRLKKYGILKRIGPDKGGHWELNIFSE